MKEIGGYFGIEIYNKKNKYYEKAYDFNYARNCLEYIIKQRRVQNIYLPIYLCNSVKEKCQSLNCKIIYYHVNEEFEPDLDKIDDNAYIYIVNYYGLLSNEKILKLKQKFKRIILDNAQAFFNKPIPDIDTIYSYRKYFGIPDGACLVSNLKFNMDLEHENVSDIIFYLVGRTEKSANEYYEDFHNSEIKIRNKNMKRISLYSENVLNVVDYENVKEVRKNNFRYIDSYASDINELNFENLEMTYMYPLLCNNSDVIRKRLIENKIYIPRLWPNIEENLLNEFEKKYIYNILPIPIDQRYEIADMERIIEIIRR